jgi:hypothetical protein
MKTHAKFSLILIVILALVAVGTVAAQSETPADGPGPCLEGTVSGTVVAVEPGEEGTWVVTVQQETLELCTVTIDGDEGGHPVATLLGQFFSNVSTEDLEEALDTVNVCVKPDGPTDDPANPPNWQIVDCGEEGAVEARVTGVEGNEVTLQAGEDTIVVFLEEDDTETAQALQDALKALLVNWDVEDDGSLQNATEEIEALHDSGMGFGVIVKLYAMAQASQEDCAPEDDGDGEPAALEEDPADPAACGVTVEELVEEFRSGTGIGQLFKEHGKPDYLGVGHVRQELKNGDDDDDEDPEAATTIFRNGPGDGQGQGNKPDVPPGQAKKQDSGPVTDIEGQSDGPANNNGQGNNNGKGNGKGKGKP